MSLEKALEENTAALKEHTATLIALINHAKQGGGQTTAAQADASPGANKPNPKAVKDKGEAQAPLKDTKKLRDEAGKMVIELVNTYNARPTAVEAIKKYGGTKVSDVPDDKIGGLHSLLAKKLKEAEAATKVEDDDLTGGVDSDLDDLDGGAADDDLSDLDD